MLRRAIGATYVNVFYTHSFIYVWCINVWISLFMSHTVDGSVCIGLYVWPVGWFVCSLVGWLVGWLAGLLAGWICIEICVNSVVNIWGRYCHSHWSLFIWFVYTFIFVWWKKNEFSSSFTINVFFLWNAPIQNTLTHSTVLSVNTNTQNSAPSPLPSLLSPLLFQTLDWSSLSVQFGCNVFFYFTVHTICAKFLVFNLSCKKKL